MRQRLAGVAASPGLCVGRAVFVESVSLKDSGRSIMSDEVQSEVQRFQEAADAAVEELQQLEKDVASRIGDAEAEIIATQAMMVLDPTLVESVIGKIRVGLISADRACLEACEEYATVMQSLDDDYLAARAGDIRDVGKRIARILTGVPSSALDFGSSSNAGAGVSNDVVVLVSDELSVSDTASLDPKRIGGIVLDSGGRTSHTAILARSMGIPAVLGVKTATTAIQSGDLVAVDGDQGEVWVVPDAQEVHELNARLEQLSSRKSRLTLLRSMPAMTVDHRRVELAANIGRETETTMVKDSGGDGVGLFRTEFLFIDRNDLPSEDEQFEAYRHVLRDLAPMPVVIRTLDVGGDKDLKYLGLPHDDNPFLGLRAIRLCLKERGIFRAQLRALLRASCYGNLRIMFPMIADVEELRQAKSELARASEEISCEGTALPAQIPTGIMVEVPSAAILADVLAGECDFFSIGTNDLVQYTMASDRGNPAVAYLSDPFHPAVLRLIKHTIDAGHQRGIWTGMCGEMAGMPEAIPLLVGMGIDELSMTPSILPAAKEIIRGFEYRSVASIWDKVSQMTSAGDVRGYLKRV